MKWSWISEETAFGFHIASIRVEEKDGGSEGKEVTPARNDKSSERVMANKGMT